MTIAGALSTRVRRGTPFRSSVGAKFFLLLGVVGLAFLAVLAVGVAGLERSTSHGQELFSHSLAQSQAAADLRGAVDDVAVATRDQTVPGVLPARVAELDKDLRGRLLPRVQVAVDTLRALDVDERQFTADLADLDTDIAHYVQLEQDIVQAAATGDDLDPTVASEAAAVLSRIAVRADRMRAEENREAGESEDQAERDRRQTLVILLSGGAGALLVGLLGVMVLIRNVVPRIQYYSHFATDVVNGRPSEPLEPRGNDELAELGHALNAMVVANEARSRSEEIQTEFVETLQGTATEDEAHDLVQRHIERLVPSGIATVLKRNNSANRLQTATALTPSNPLVDRIAAAEPRSCLAVRFGRTHTEGGPRAPLLGCSLCMSAGGRSTCEPLLVSGEVIGAVLVHHDDALVDDQRVRIKTSVMQSAPVLANLRNLAVAEFRANNDALTGLPNKRATDDTLKRMVAQANRSLSPLTAVMLDLDHFKPINDRFGHAKGDEVLAAVGSALGSALRASDFAGRFGGEEFLLLLPDTSSEEALRVAEKVRVTIAATSVAGVDLPISASLGLAELPAHAGNAATLLREADRALYAAKTAGRNQVVAARPGEDTALGSPEGGVHATSPLTFPSVRRPRVDGVPASGLPSTLQ